MRIRKIAEVLAGKRGALVGHIVYAQPRAHVSAVAPVECVIEASVYGCHCRDVVANFFPGGGIRQSHSIVIELADPEGGHCRAEIIQPPRCTQRLPVFLVTRLADQVIKSGYRITGRNCSVFLRGQQNIRQATWFLVIALQERADITEVEQTDAGIQRVINTDVDTFNCAGIQVGILVTDLQ